MKQRVTVLALVAMGTASLVCCDRSEGDGEPRAEAESPGQAEHAAGSDEADTGGEEGAAARRGDRAKATVEEADAEDSEETAAGRDPELVSCDPADPDFGEHIGIPREYRDEYVHCLRGMPAHKVLWMEFTEGPTNYVGIRPLTGETRVSHDAELNAEKRQTTRMLEARDDAAGEVSVARCLQKALNELDLEIFGGYHEPHATVYGFCTPSPGEESGQ